MAADTVHLTDHPALQRPKLTRRDPLHPGYLEMDAPVPPASELKLEDIDVVDGELWRQGKDVGPLRALAQRRSSPLGSRTALWALTGRLPGMMTSWRSTPITSDFHPAGNMAE